MSQKNLSGTQTNRNLLRPLSTPELDIPDDNVTLKKASQSLRGLKIIFSPRVPKDNVAEPRSIAEKIIKHKSFETKEDAQDATAARSNLPRQQSYKKTISKEFTQYPLPRQKSLKDLQNPISLALLKRSFRNGKDESPSTTSRESTTKSPGFQRNDSAILKPPRASLPRTNAFRTKGSGDIEAQNETRDASSLFGDMEDPFQSSANTASSEFSQVLSPPIGDRSRPETTEKIAFQRNYSAGSKQNRNTDQHPLLVDIKSPMSSLSSLTDDDSECSVSNSVKARRKEFIKNLSVSALEPPNDDDLENMQKFLISPRQRARHNLRVRPDSRKEFSRELSRELSKPSLIFKVFEGSSPRTELNSTESNSVTGLGTNIPNTNLFVGNRRDSEESLYDIIDAMYAEDVDEGTR